MGSLLVGHVAIGMGFLLTGLWHLFNHIKLHSLHPTTYTSSSWFPTQPFRYAEPILISVASATYIVMELFVSPSRHQPFDNDWTIPSYHLHNLEHSSISFSLLAYALSCIALDRVPVCEPRTSRGLAQVVASVVFFQELLLIHLHSTDHTGPEGQYHWLQQIAIAVSFVTTVVGVGLPGSFLVSFVRSVSIALQGFWFAVMGFALWSPGLVPKGCGLEVVDGRAVVRCRDLGTLERAKALANLEFSWTLSGMVISSVVFYLVLSNHYAGKNKYVALDKEGDLELQKINGGEAKFGCSTFHT